MLRPLNLYLRKEKGLTLLEMIISIGIFVLVAATTSTVFINSLRAYGYANSRMSAAREAALAMDWIMRDIMFGWTGTKTAPSINALSGINTIVLDNGDGPPNDLIRYALDGDRTIRRVRENAPGSPRDLLARNIDTLEFRYYKPDHDQAVNLDADTVMIEVIIVANVNGQEFRLYNVVNR